MKKYFVILLLTVAVLVSACASETDSPAAEECVGTLEGASVVENTEEQSLPETESTAQTERAAQTQNTTEIQSTEEATGAAEEETLTKCGDFAAMSISLDPAGLRPDGGIWAPGGNKVYFGQFDGIPTAYRVLSSPDTQTVSCDSGSLLLDCDTVLMLKAFDDDFRRNDSQIKIPSEWKGSDIDAWLNGSDFYGNRAVFSRLEKAAIAGTAMDEEPAVYTIGNWTYEDYGAQGHIFLLSAAEADGLYSENAARVKTGGSTSWWLRSSFGNGGNGVGSIHGDGHICNNSITNFGVGVSPSLNVNLSSILFVSAVGTDNAPDLTETGTEAEGSASREWKMTLLDTGKAVKITDGQTVTRKDTDEGAVITVPYTYAGNDVTRISVMITDKEHADVSAQVLYYGAVQGVSADDTTGTGTFLLPSDLTTQVCGTDYYVYILAEDVNGEYETDYASSFYSITIPAAPVE